MLDELTPKEKAFVRVAPTVYGPGHSGYRPITEEEQKQAEAMLAVPEGTHYPYQLIRKPMIGDVVVFFPNPDDAIGRSNSAKVCPAIITRIWGNTGTCNLKMIPDHGPMQDRGSVSHKSGNISNYSWCFQEEFEEGIRRGQWSASEY